MKKMRSYNFGAGPSMLPESILLEAKEELLDWQGLGMSVMETGHRTAPFIELMQQLETLFRELLFIPSHYHVLFLGGAARTQFAMIPMNLISEGAAAAYVISGLWSNLAYEEACKLKKAYCIARPENNAFIRVPKDTNWELSDNTAYLYFTLNETVNGVHFNTIPSFSEVPLVADMTSCLLCEPIKISDYGLIFAGAQKNISIAGLTIVIIRDDLLDRVPSKVLPTMLDYRTHVTHQSLYATPPTFNCYLALKMMQWIKAQGGVEPLYKLNCEKAALLYDYIDSSSFYSCLVDKDSRSIENVCFVLNQPKFEKEFIHNATKQGLCALKGHRTVGGIRASLYNAMPIAGVRALIAFMQTFAKEHS